MNIEKEIAFRKGYKCFELGNYRNAILFYTEAIEFSGGTYNPAYQNRGLSKIMLGNYSGALEDFMVFLRNVEEEQNPRDLIQLENVYVNTGYALFNLKQYENAKIYYEKALKTCPNDLDIKMMLFDINLKLRK